MRIISHRGNLKGRIPERENTPSYIDSAIACGYEVEIDVRYINGQFMLGHDAPEIAVNAAWLLNRKSKIWIHSKDVLTIVELRNLDNTFQTFCHTRDPFVLTSTGHIWIHDLTLELGSHAIIPLLTKEEVILYSGEIVYAICTDYPFFAKNKFILGSSQ
jgi:hypothetical protein